MNVRIPNPFGRSTVKNKPVTLAKPLTKEPLVRTPEQQKMLDEMHQQMGQALVDNLNRNVLKNGH